MVNQIGIEMNHTWYSPGNLNVRLKMIEKVIFVVQIVLIVLKYFKLIALTWAQVLIPFFGFLVLIPFMVLFFYLWENP